jgi:hypothetical protein
MFDSSRKLSERLASAVDLVIDFATLGEYGLEPAAEPPGCRDGRRRPAPGRPPAIARDRAAVRG